MKLLIEHEALCGSLPSLLGILSTVRIVPLAWTVQCTKPEIAAIWIWYRQNAIGVSFIVAWLKTTKPN
jgi:hypothetical protein